MYWLEPLRQDTERIRQENIKIREETERLREENRKLKSIDIDKLIQQIIKQPKLTMKIFLDTADVSLIKPAYDTSLIDGVTTNPTLILRSGRQLKEVITEISESFPKLESISAEVVGDTADEMLRQAAEYTEIPNVTIKVPCTVEGLKVCKELSSAGIKTNVTLVFSVAQSILASKAGATYISPFVGRWEDNSVDGIELIRNIREVYDRSGTTTQILAASIRNVRQVEQCAKYGADVVTIPPLVFWALYKNVLTTQGLAQFDKDWKEVLGQ
jgi:transaldolase